MEGPISPEQRRLAQVRSLIQGNVAFSDLTTNVRAQVSGILDTDRADAQILANDLHESVQAANANLHSNLPFANERDSARTRIVAQRGEREMHDLTARRLGQLNASHNALIHKIENTDPDSMDKLSPDEIIMALPNVTSPNFNVSGFMECLDPTNKKLLNRIIEFTLSSSDATELETANSLASDFMSWSQTRVNGHLPPIPNAILSRGNKDEQERFVEAMLLNMRSMAQQLSQTTHSMIRPQAARGLWGVYLEDQELARVRENPDALSSVIGKNTSARIAVYFVGEASPQEFYGTGKELANQVRARCTDRSREPLTGLTGILKKPFRKLRDTFRGGAPVDGSVIVAMQIKQDEDVLRTFTECSQGAKFSWDFEGTNYTVTGTGTEEWEIDPSSSPFARDPTHPLKYMPFNINFLTPTYTPSGVASRAELSPEQASREPFQQLQDILLLVQPSREVLQAITDYNNTTRVGDREAWKAVDYWAEQMGRLIASHLLPNVDTHSWNSFNQAAAQGFLRPLFVRDILLAEFEKTHLTRDEDMTKDPPPATPAPTPSVVSPPSVTSAPPPSPQNANTSLDSNVNAQPSHPFSGEIRQLLVSEVGTLIGNAHMHSDLEPALMLIDDFLKKHPHSSAESVAQMFTTLIIDWITAHPQDTSQTLQKAGSKYAIVRNVLIQYCQSRRRP